MGALGMPCLSSSSAPERQAICRTGQARTQIHESVVAGAVYCWGGEAKAISGKDSTGLACLSAQKLRYRSRYRALLCARRSTLPLPKNPAPFR